MVSSKNTHSNTQGQTGTQTDRTITVLIQKMAQTKKNRTEQNIHTDTQRLRRRHLSIYELTQASQQTAIAHKILSVLVGRFALALGAAAVRKQQKKKRGGGKGCSASM